MKDWRKISTLSTPGIEPGHLMQTSRNLSYVSHYVGACVHACVHVNRPFKVLGHISSRISGCIPGGCVFLCRCIFVKLTDLIFMIYEFYVPSSWRGLYPASIRGGVNGFNVYPGTGCVSFSAFCPVLSLAVALRLCWTQIQGGPLLCLSSFLVHSLWLPYMQLTHRHLGWKSQWRVITIWKKKVEFDEWWSNGMWKRKSTPTFAFMTEGNDEKN